MVRVAETIDEAMETAALELVRESLSISMAGEGPWWQPAGRKLGSVPYHLWTWSDLDLCRLESQRMMTHNEFGIGGTTKRVDYVVDQGFKYSIVESKGEVVQKADIDQLNEYLELITSANSFAELEAETVLRMDRDGEVFLRLFWNDDGIVDVRFVEPARVRPGPGADTSLNSIERWGIAVEPHDAKRITGYWVEPGIGETPELIPEDEIVHIIHSNGGAIPRGIPVYQPVFENLRRCEDLLTGMSSIAKARAKIALIRKIAGLNAVKSENIKSRLTSGTQQNPDGTLRNVSIDEYPFGSVIRANQDETFEFPSSNVGAADLIQVLQADLRSIASLLSMPEWMFTGLADQKYSNAFVVEAPTLKAFRRLQGKLVKGLATGRYKSQASVLWRCLRMAAERDVISKDVLTKCKIKCVPPSLEARDKQSESSVNKTYLDAGVIDKQTVQESIGLDPVETNRRIAAEKAAAPPAPPMIPGVKPSAGTSPLPPKLTKVGESWYTPEALEWIAEGRDRSHLIRTKTVNKKGVTTHVYRKPAKSGQGERSRSPMEHPIDQKAAAEFASTGRAAAFRVQDNRKPLPKESGNHWTDGEGETMGGVSGHANLSNAVADLLFGERESVTGENYSNNIREDGGEPQIVVLSGRQIDAPGSEIVVPNPKIAAVISQQQLQDWFKPIAREILKNAGGDQAAIDDVDRLTPAEIADKYSFDKRDKSDIQDHIEKSIRDYVSNITLQLSQSSVQVGESWYTLDALEWITEGRDRSHLVKTKITDKNGISRTVYKRPAKSANSKTDTQKPDATGKADSPSPAKPQSRTDTEAKSLVDYFKNGGEAQGDTPQDRMHFVFGKLKSLFKSSTPKPEPLKILDYQKPQVDRVAAMINKSEGLTEEHKKEYTAATEEVLSRMPKAAHWRILRNLDNAEFSPDPKSMTLKFLNRIMDDPEKEGISISKIMTYATWQTRIEKQGLDEFAYGIYSTKNKRLDLDGGGLVKDGPFGTPNGAKVKDVYAHEFGHVLDGPYHEISGSGEFRNAYFEEILGGVGRAGSDLMQDPYPEGAPVPLTEYAKTSPEEGFGEFCRLVYSGSHDLAKVQAAFPKCSNVLVMRGLWPEQVNAK